MKVLMVDDDPLARTSTSSLLRKFGYQVLEAEDGEAAWRILQAERINLLISDWMMPNLSGTELCRKVRAAGFDHYIYVILCTSRGRTEDLVEGMDSGADDFLTKPFPSDELRVRVRAGERILKLEGRLADKNRELERARKKLLNAYECIEADVKAAAWLQEGLLPPPALKRLGVGYDWRFRPSSYMSGDIFNFFAVDESHVAFYLLDVAGHGVPAAMMSVALSLALTPHGDHSSPIRRYDRAREVAEAIAPEEVISELNRRFQTKDDRYFTMTYGLLNLQSSVLRLAQAGNPNPVLIESGGDIRRLTAGGMPVGLWPKIDFDLAEVSFRPGDRLLLYSDGISECTNGQDEEFGDQRLLSYLTESAQQPLDSMLTGLEQRLETWRGSSSFSGDISLLAVEALVKDS